MARIYNIGIFAVAAIGVSLSACGNGSELSTAAGPPVAGAQRSGALENLFPKMASGKIQHIVIIVQENRSVDNLFQGFSGADTQSYGYTSTGQKVTLQPVGLETTWDIAHISASFFEACDGQGNFPGTDCKMDGFDKEHVTCGGSGPPCPNQHPQYSYVPHNESKPYFDMGKQYVLADEMFASNFDGSSFISHQYIIAGQASSTVNYPANIWGCDGGPTDTIALVTQDRQISHHIQACFDNRTLGDELDAAAISWRFYTADLNGNGGLWSAYQAIRHIRYGKDWNTDIVSPQKKFFQDVGNNLPAVSWITPTCQNSDHAGCGSNTGPSWVASLVNAIGTSKYWDSTAIFIMWDDYGGWYDHVGPNLVDYDGFGIRIPLLVISPYAKQGHVSHVLYEHGSILKFVEDQFGLPRLSASDSRATSPEADCFDFSQAPRTFKPIQSPLRQSYFEHQPLDRRVPDGE